MQLLKQFFYKGYYGGVSALFKQGLFHAVKTGNKDLTNHLLTKANVNNQDENGNTALHYAIKNNYSGIAEMLLGWEANPNVTNNNGMTPLNIASADNHPNCRKILLDNGAKITNADLWYALRNKEIGTMYDLLANKQVHSSPKISSNLKEFTKNAGSLLEVIKDYLSDITIDNSLCDNVHNNDVTLLADDI
ncbi:ankyrin repeat domain-containing protein [Rickettsia endosymbiont of Culicoides newsteadi]|uniref:ankyrin repeat domain-containing protein n=1 Tax=Rickettsia endosymbiont of Culicoides newsteadi TaxID=1961830 RepID=UPI000B9B52F3|nr:ankyrin repeat domain-containing protein [Rickettsia endosymbiont of Culicoides newsteadi]OZG32264.1 ankyrin, BRAIN variant 2 (ank2) [Rickettsia endosymbiont of Culicoides newsteadi]